MKHKKILTIVIVIAILIVPIISFGYSGINTSIDGLHNIGMGEAAQSTKIITGRMLGVFQVIGTIVSVVALIIIGIRYMVSSVDGKASMKGVLIYYVIGAVFVFATPNVVAMAFDTIDYFKHTWVSTTVEPTCTTPGSVTSTCTICGKTSEHRKAPKGHKLSWWKTETQATCIALETQKRICTRDGCGYNETRTVGKLSKTHKWKLGYTGGGKNQCALCGIECNHAGKTKGTTTYEQSGHYYKIECKNCKAVISDNLYPHLFDSNTGFCDCGRECSHTWISGFCSICKMAYPCTGHNWNHGVCNICHKTCSHPNSSTQTFDLGSFCNYITRCQTCGELISDGIMNPKHASSSEPCDHCGHTHHIVSGTCSGCGYTICSHAWSSGTCSICGITHTGCTYVGGASGYNNGNGTHIRTYTCSTCGGWYDNIGEPHINNGSGVCKICGATM